MAQWHKCLIANATGFGLDSLPFPLEDIKYFIFSLPRAMHGVGFCHLTSNASIIRQKVGTGSVFMGAECQLMCGIQSEALIIQYRKIIQTHKKGSFK